MTEEELRKEKERLIKVDIESVENRVRHAFNQGYELGYQQHSKDFVERGEKAYQQGLEDGRKQGVAIDGDKRYWDGYHAAQEDGRKIYDKGYEDGAKCQDEVQYQKGLDDAWNMVKYICLGGKERVLLKVFCTFSITKIITDNTASEAIEKIREYEEKQKQEEAKERFREKLESGYFSGKQKQSCDNCIHNDKEWHSEPCDGCTLSDSHYVSASDPIESEKTVYPDSPCDLCRFNPPSSFDGKPCTMCPAEGRSNEQ